MIEGEIRKRETSRERFTFNPGVMPEVDVLTIAEDPGAPLMNMRSKTVNFLPNAGAIDSVLYSPNGLKFKIMVLEPMRLERVGYRGLPVELDERGIVDI